jgi:hypothetical protein
VRSLTYRRPHGVVMPTNLPAHNSASPTTADHPVSTMRTTADVQGLARVEARVFVCEECNGPGDVIWAAHAADRNGLSQDLDVFLESSADPRLVKRSGTQLRVRAPQQPHAACRDQAGSEVRVGDNGGCASGQQDARNAGAQHRRVHTTQHP